MANKNLFQLRLGQAAAASRTSLNEEGAPAYASAKHGLAQYAATGCLNATFYAGADEQLATVLALCAEGGRSSSPRRPCTAADAAT